MFFFPFPWKTPKKAHLENLVGDGEKILSPILWKTHCDTDDGAAAVAAADDYDDVGLRTEFS